MNKDYETFIETHNSSQIYLYPRYTSKIQITLRTWTLFSSPKSFSDFFDASIIANLNNTFLKVKASDKKIECNLSLISSMRLSNAQVIGRSHKEFLYLDTEDNGSVWILFTKDMSVQKASDSFRNWLANSQTESSYVNELMSSLENCSSSSRKRAKRREFS